MPPSTAAPTRPPRRPALEWAADARRAFRAWIEENGYPCVMAKSVVRREQYRLRAYRQLGDEASARRLAHDLTAFGQAPEPDRGFRSFIAVFGGPLDLDERGFERALWDTLRLVHRADSEPWDPAVSSDPASSEFSFSVGGQAFYVVGMHPGASRAARRFERPLVVFNLHAQFEALREEGRYEKVRDLIRDRDRALQGSVNPAVKDFGTQSEARQYAGRDVPAAWRCPFHPDPDAD